LLKISFNQQLPNLNAQFLGLCYAGRFGVRSPPSNRFATPSIAWCFQAPIIVWWQIDETALRQTLKAEKSVWLHNPAGLSSAYIR